MLGPVKAVIVGEPEQMASIMGEAEQTRLIEGPMVKKMGQDKPKLHLKKAQSHKSFSYSFSFRSNWSATFNHNDAFLT